MATNVTLVPSHKSRRIRWGLVAGIAAVMCMIPLAIWYKGIIDRAVTPELSVVGGNPAETDDIVKKQVVAKKTEPPPEKEKKVEPDTRWEEAMFKQQMTLFETGWREYFQLRQSAFDRGMQRTEAGFKQEIKTAEVRYDEAHKALRSVSDGNLYNNTEKADGQAAGEIGPQLQGVLARREQTIANATTQEQPGQPESASFAQSSPLSTNYLTAPRSPYILYAGTHLPITLDQWMNSNAKGGSWVGHVNADVYDSLYAKHLLIPAGTRVFGLGSPETDNNEQPVLNLTMTLLMFPPNEDYPNGAYLAAPGTQAQNQLGIQGLNGEVNHHRLQRYGSAFVLGAIVAGVRMATYSGHGYYGGYQLAPEDAAAQGFSQVLGEVIGEELRRKLRIRPTVTVPLGYNFIATVHQIQEFPGPYRR